MWSGAILALLFYPFSGSPETLRLKHLMSSSPKFDLTEHCSNLVSGSSEEPGASEEPTSVTSQLYSEVMLDWLQEWDQKARDLVRLDALLYIEGIVISYACNHMYYIYCNSKTCVKWPHSKWPQIGFQNQLSLNAGQKNCRMLPLEHSAILSTFIMLPFVVKTFVLSIFEWLFYAGFTVF